MSQESLKGYISNEPPAMSKHRKHDGPFITPLHERTQLPFKEWVRMNKVPYDPSPYADYDMPGFYLASMGGDPRAKSSISEYDKKMHYPDYWKTPYHQTFSNESQYALADTAPYWKNNQLFDRETGEMLADETPRKPKP
jgi:hypothetical protein